ncbi:hypothetical protein V5P93_006205 [Actinokineospora auranticolor]|uniref:Uncharacterized protein n=1 Tax=Actinokineospora auranticolor TaxID=155976 RepID=A0A2S6GI14_9PSEU|nr:hypothetical protein [Actinokineospora auranticolor]PPK64801.1 hypothetical protein CLV40_11740 [Actinokineospora auranticolor]
MWHIESFTSTAMVDQVPVKAMSPADFARVVGLDERTCHDGNMLEITEPMKAALGERLNFRFDPELDYFAHNLADFDGQVLHGMANFADELLPFQEEHGNRLVFGVADTDVEDHELALLLTSHSRYPRPPHGFEFTETSREEVLRVLPEDADLIARTSSVFTATEDYVLLIDRGSATVTLIKGKGDVTPAPAG